MRLMLPGRQVLPVPGKKLPQDQFADMSDCVSRADIDRKTMYAGLPCNTGVLQCSSNYILKSAETGAWSDGRSSMRGPVSMRQPVHLPARCLLARM